MGVEHICPLNTEDEGVPDGSAALKTDLGFEVSSRQIEGF
jgi:hypothetical protein